MPQRRFFQIHLSTAVVLMLVAGVLVWANVRERQGDMVQFSKRDGRGIAHLCHYGWPLECHEKFRMDDHSNSEIESITSTWFKEKVAYNALIAFAILLSVCVACEWLIRRREARKANE